MDSIFYALFTSINWLEEDEQCPHKTFENDFLSQIYGLASNNVERVYFVNINNLKNYIMHYSLNYIVEVKPMNVDQIHTINHESNDKWRISHDIHWSEITNVTYGNSYDINKIQTHKILFTQGYDNLYASLNRLIGSDYDIRFRLYENKHNLWDFVHYLSSHNHLSSVRLVLEFIVDIYKCNNLSDELKHTIQFILNYENITAYIHTAANNNAYDIVKYFMNFDCDLEICLELASRDGQISLVTELLEKGVKPNDNALIGAAQNAHFEIAKLLLENKVNIHADNDLILRQAVRKHNLEMVKYLIEKGANIHAEDDESLKIAARKGNLEIVKYLVEHGANIHAQKDYAFKWSFLKVHTDVNAYLKNLVYTTY